jgi:hypothetical protein
LEPVPPDIPFPADIMILNFMKRERRESNFSEILQILKKLTGFQRLQISGLGR